MAALSFDQIVAQAQAQAAAAVAAAAAAQLPSQQQAPVPYRTGGAPYVIDPLVQPGTRMVPEGWSLLNWLRGLGVETNQPNESGYRVDPLLQLGGNVAPLTPQVDPNTGYRIGPLDIPAGQMVSPNAHEFVPSPPRPRSDGWVGIEDPVIEGKDPGGRYDTPRFNGTGGSVAAAQRAGTVPAPTPVPGGRVPSLRDDEKQAQEKAAREQAILGQASPGNPLSLSEAMDKQSSSGKPVKGKVLAVPGADSETPSGSETEQGKGPASNTPAGPSGEKFLMRPRGLSGEGGKREDAINLTNYEGLANNATARRLSWAEYNAMSQEEQDAADLNKLLVRSREKDLNRKRELTGDALEQYKKDVESIFGAEGGSEVIAPKTVDLLKSINFDGVGKDLDDFLSLREGISVGEVKKPADAEKALAASVQTKAGEAFSDPNNQYWNLNSAIRGNTVQDVRKKYIPAGYGGAVRDADVPEEDADKNPVWTKDRAVSTVWDNLKVGAKGVDKDSITDFLKSLNEMKVFEGEEGQREFWDSLYLRAMNEKLYGPSEAAKDAEGNTMRTADEILKILGMRD